MAPLSNEEKDRRARRRAAVAHARAIITAAKRDDLKFYPPEDCRVIKANRQKREFLLAELGRPNLSAVVKTLVEREIQEVEIRSSAVKHRTINGRCRTGTFRRVIPGRGVIAPRSIRPLSFTPYRLWRHHGPAYDQR